MAVADQAVLTSPPNVVVAAQLLLKGMTCDC